MSSHGSENYEDYREDFKPHGQVKVLFIGESPPDPKGGELRYFYKPELSKHDYFYRAVAKAVYGDDVDVEDKLSVLRSLQSDGFWIVDAIEFPVNDWRKYSDED